MIWLVLFGVLCFAGGFLIGWHWRRKKDNAGWVLAAEYKAQADMMMDRLVELENIFADDGG